MLQKTILIAVFCILAFAGTIAQVSPVKKLIILHSNDLHSRLNGFSPENEYTPLSINDDKTLGGFARIATLINEEKKKNVSNSFKRIISSILYLNRPGAQWKLHI